jgi:hypothetical protein
LLFHERSQPLLQLGAVPRLTLPDDEDIPSGLTQGGEFLAVPLHVALELPTPEVRVVLGDRQNATDSVPVPKAAMHENNLLMPGKYDVGLAGELLVVQTETVAATV